jgi:hypothetical protein
MDSEKLDTELDKELLALGISRFDYDKSPNKTTHFIGLGNCGCNVLQFFHQKGLEGKYTGIAELGARILYADINYISFTPPRYDPFNLSNPKVLFPDMRQKLVMPAEVKDLFRENHRYVLIAGLGGYTGTKMVEELTHWLDDVGEVFVTICSLPFHFEGKIRNTIAEKSLIKLRQICNFRYFDHISIMDHCVDLTVPDVFRLGNQKFYETYNSFIRFDEFMRNDCEEKA